VGSIPTPGTMNLRSVAHGIARAFDTHKPLVEVSISRSALLHNLNTYRKQYPKLKFATVLKSNAYGHGLVTIAKLLDKQKLAFFMVDSYFEARTLRRTGIRTRILILGYVDSREIAESTLKDVDYGIVDLEQLRELAKITKKPTRIHLKIDTGMHRHGIEPENLDEAIGMLKVNSNLEVVGVCSHFADADSHDPTFTLHQISVWNKAVQKVEIAFPEIEYRHIAATKGIPMSERANANVARLGIGFYGFDTSPSGDAPLKPILEMRSIITSIRDVQPGEYVGYNITYSPKIPSRIATVPVGYFEGVDRRLSNKGYMLVDGIACPIVGRVSMNMSSIDVTDVPDAEPGDEVIVISRDPDQPNSIPNIVKQVSTPIYEEAPHGPLVHIAQTLRRVID
jgi:alanine racemase